MTVGKTNDGLRIADFECYEDVHMEPHTANFKVQMMRDGNIYMTELPKRRRNKPMFRDDNCALTLGHDGKFYFFFSLPAQLLDELPQQLVRQASAIAQKVIRDLLTIENL